MSDTHDEYAMLQAFGGACSLGMDALRLSIGQKPKQHSPETIAKMRAVQGAIGMKPEIRAARSAALKGKLKSSEHRAAIADAARNREARKRSDALLIAECMRRRISGGSRESHLQRLEEDA